MQWEFSDFNWQLKGKWNTEPYPYPYEKLLLCNALMHQTHNTILRLKKQLLRDQQELLVVSIK